MPSSLLSVLIPSSACKNTTHSKKCLLPARSRAQFSCQVIRTKDPDSEDSGSADTKDASNASFTKIYNLESRGLSVLPAVDCSSSHRARRISGSQVIPFILPLLI